MAYQTTVETPIGTVLLEERDGFLTGLWFDRSPDPGSAPEGAAEPEVITQTKEWLTRYFAGEVPAFTPPLKLSGTPFRKRVLELLLEIPYGRTVSYGDIAQTIAKERGIPKMAAQAVGGAVRKNDISLIVPCHRVIGTDGTLVGYGGRLDRKDWLLRLEHEGYLREKESSK